MISKTAAGCWFDGTRGFVGVATAIIETAIAYGLGMQELSDEDCADTDTLVFESDNAIDYLNTLVPDGYTFSWWDGDFGLYSNTDLEEYHQ